jgi:hypothetical protein
MVLSASTLERWVALVEMIDLAAGARTRHGREPPVLDPLPQAPALRAAPRMRLARDSLERL